MSFDSFLAAVDDALTTDRLVSLTLSGAVAASGIPSRQTVRPIELRGARLFQWTSRHGTQERHVNRNQRETLAHCAAELGTHYRNARLVTTEAEWEARLTRRGKPQVHRRPARHALPVLAHDRSPEHLLPEGVPCPFLIELGVMTPEGRVRAPQHHKFRQINRYLEFVRDILDELPATGRLEVVDCGCGKSGLTFALQHYLTHVCGRDVHIVGLDRNADVLQTCRALAARLGLPGMEFLSGDIAAYVPPGPVHLVVSLHACDTATDLALAQAVRWETNVIFAVPCCHHELAPRLQCAPLEGLLMHGLLRERLAADVTDALRAAYLEMAGYRTQVVEFIELEHTPKNLLLRGVRRSPPAPEAVARARIRAGQLQQLFAIDTFALPRALDEYGALAGDSVGD